jgi:hypothetical protein
MLQYLEENVVSVLIDSQTSRVALQVASPLHTSPTPSRITYRRSQSLIIVPEYLRGAIRQGAIPCARRRVHDRRRPRGYAAESMPSLLTALYRVRTRRVYVADPGMCRSGYVAFAMRRQCLRKRKAQIDIKDVLGYSVKVVYQVKLIIGDSATTERRQMRGSALIRS